MKNFKIKLANDNFLRPYGSTNFAEFFAVLLEHYIEGPLELQQHYPKVFKHLRVLLNRL